MTIINNFSQIKEKLSKLAYLGQYEKGLFFIEKYTKKHPKDTEKILPKKAFFLYHHAADLLYNNSKKTSLKIQKNTSMYFDQAITICKKIIQNKHKINKIDYLNTRIYLAQIYVMLKYFEKAQKLAIQTYKYRPCSLTAERVADIYIRSNDFNNAIIWYEKAVKKTKIPTQKLIAQIGLSICYKKMKDNKRATKEALIALDFLKQSGKDKNTLLLKKTLFAYFPKITINKK